MRRGASCAAAIDDRCRNGKPSCPVRRHVCARRRP